MRGTENTKFLLKLSESKVPSTAQCTDISDTTKRKIRLNYASVLSHQFALFSTYQNVVLDLFRQIFKLHVNTCKDTQCQE